MRIGKITTLVVMLSLMVCSGSFAMVSVYLRDGGEIKAQKAWGEGGTVHVLVNRDTLVDLDPEEVDLPKSKLRMKPQEKLLDQVIELAGTRRQLEKMLKSTSTDDDFDKVLKQNFNPADAEKVVRGHLSKKLDQKTLANVLVWLKNPVGKKVSAAEEVSDPDRKKKMKDFLGQEATPALKERMPILLDIERSTGLSEMEVRLFGRMIRKVVKAVPADFPDRASVVEKLYNNVPPLETLRKQNAAESAYTFRELTLDELREYRGFLASAAGKEYMAATMGAAGEIFSPAMEKLGEALAADMAKSIASAGEGETSAESAEEICTASAAEVSKKLPVKIDAVTTATGITCESTTLVYKYALQNYDAGLLTNLVKNESLVRSNVCKNSQLVETHIKNGVSIQYSYCDGSGALLHSILVTPKDCGL